MNKWKIAFLLSMIILIASSLYLSYQFLDTGISNAYISDTVGKQDEVIKILGEILVEQGKEFSKKDVLFLLRNKYPEGFIVEDSSSIIYHGIEFTFEKDSLISISDKW